ncbi:MAG: tetratricopeptide repeat protein [Candidatus Aminicenantes bacterium]|nr:tetratricopeptide repeat protein [Candidatus Aminicenantes bacterium]
MKGKERHHLKEDEFIHGMHGVVVFFQKWRTQLVMAGLLVVGLGVVFAGFQVIRAQQAKSQSRTLGEILALRADLPKVPENVAKLEALTGKGTFGRVASLGLATYWLEQGQTDKAQTALSSIKDSPRDFYYYQAKNLEAEITLLKGDPDGALAILNKIVEEKPKDYVLDAVLFRQAEALEKKGKTAEALALYKKVQAEYPQSYFGYDASLKVNKLEGARKRP